MSEIVRLNFKSAKALPESVREANEISDSVFAQIKVSDSGPKVEVESVESPAKRVKKVLERENIEIEI